MRCESVMQRQVISVSPETSVQDAARLMRDHNVGFLPVCDPAGRAIGVITDRDLAIRLCAEDGAAGQTQVGTLMTRELVSCRPDDQLADAEELMARNRKQRVLVLDEIGAVAGVITLTDVIVRDSDKHAARTYRKIVLREYRF